MESITLGKNGQSVTPLCLGTWAWGDKLFWNYGDEYGSEQVEQAFNAAIEADITFFDTAEVYGLGLSEELIGQFRKKTDKQVQIATKFAPLPWRFSAESVSDALTESLKRLQVEQIALYQVHWPFTFFMSQETLMNALATEVEKGRISAIGVSNYSQSQMQEAHQILARRGIPLAVNQVRYSLLTRQVESQGIIVTAKQLGVTILAYSPLAQGLLTGKYTVENSINPTGARKIDPRFSKESLQKIEPVISLLRTIGEKYNRTPAQVALNWLIAQGNVIPISGVKTAEQVKQNAGALGWELSDDEIVQLNEVTRPWLN
ncbi:MAG: aldo/keto reductase [Cyanobacteria bacterium P01_D01_bin.50]